MYVKVRLFYYQLLLLYLQYLLPVEQCTNQSIAQVNNLSLSCVVVCEKQTTIGGPLSIQYPLSTFYQAGRKLKSIE